MATARGGDGDLGPFAELLLRHRVAAGLSQRELARRSGLSERALRDLERGATARPRRHSVRAVAAALELTDHELAAFVGTATEDTAPQAPPVDLCPAAELVGRADELRVLADLVTGGRHRIVTVTGPAGVGKSRLAAALVSILRRRNVPEVRAVDLSALREPELLGEVIAEALGYGGNSRLNPVDRIAVQLRDRRMVLVLDCCERLVAAAPEIAALVRRCPGLTVLATSQRPLHVAGERLVRLDPLPLPAAVDLFVRLAAASAPGFALTPANAEAVTTICRQLDGLPLAIELAAARVRLLTPAELAHRLDRRLPVLTGGHRDLPPRHRSLRAALEASVEVVAEPARTLFTWFGAFTGGGLLADVEAVAAALGRDDGWLLVALTELVDTSLVRVSTEDGASRYALPDAMGELATEWLGGDAGVARAVAARYLARVRDWNQDPSGPARVVAGGDAGNLRAALAWAVRHEPALLDGPTLYALRQYYELTGRLAEGQAALGRAGAAGVPMAWVTAGHLGRLRGDLAEATRLGELALAHLDPADHVSRALTHLQLGSANTERRDFHRARSHLRAALAHAGRARDIRLVGRALNNLGTLSMERGRLRDAERLLTAALEAKRRAGASDVERGRTLFNLAETALAAGDHELAARRGREATGVLRSGGYHRLAAQAATAQAMALWLLGDLRPALAAATLATELAGEAPDDRRSTSMIGLRHSIVLHAAGRPAAAAAALRRAVPLGLDGVQRDRDEVAQALEAHAAILAGTAPETATHLLGAAERLRRDHPVDLDDGYAAIIERATTGCRAALGDARFEHERRRGGRLDRAALVGLCDRLATASG